MATKKLVMDQLSEELLEHLSSTCNVDLDLGGSHEPLNRVVKGIFTFIADQLGENKSTDEPITLVVPEMVEFKVEYRKGGEGDGAFAIGATLLPEMKKRIKDDELIEELDD